MRICLWNNLFRPGGGGVRIRKRLDFSDGWHALYKNDILGPLNKEAPHAWYSRSTCSLGSRIVALVNIQVSVR